jgi:hypothetical protein
MTPKEKALEIYDTIYSLIDKEAESAATSCNGATKDIALFMVDQILDAGSQEIVNEYFDDRYWAQVRTEIKNDTFRPETKSIPVNGPVKPNRITYEPRS